MTDIPLTASDLTIVPANITAAPTFVGSFTSGSTQQLLQAHSREETKKGVDLPADHPVVLRIAEMCHNVNRIWCNSNGDYSHPSWDSLALNIKASVIAGVRLHLKNPNTTPEQSHESWLAFKEAEGGWKYAPVKNLEKKEHPCFRPYAELPLADKIKDHLFRNTIHAMAPLLLEDYHAQ